MANLTIALDNNLLQRARIRALEQGTSVNALLRDYLASYADEKDIRTRAIEEFLQIAADEDSGSGGKKWTRDELHER